MVQTEAQYLFIFKALLDWTRTMLSRAEQKLANVVSSVVTEVSAPPWGRGKGETGVSE
jgi:hypothetical protein